MLINRDYFKNGDIYLPNMNEPDPNNKNVKDLEYYIQICESDIYLSAFGYKMAEDFKSYIKDGISINTPQNYLDIINGKSYTKDDKEYFWHGLITDTPKRSLIADLVYYTYKKNNSTQSVDFGEVVINSKIGNIASNTPKMVNSWNSFVDSFAGGYRSNPDGLTLEGNPYWLIGDRGVDYYGCFNNENVCLLKFLNDNKENYPLLSLDVRSINLSYKNSFGL